MRVPIKLFEKNHCSQSRLLILKCRSQQGQLHAFEPFYDRNGSLLALINGSRSDYLDSFASNSEAETRF